MHCFFRFRDGIVIVTATVNRRLYDQYVLDVSPCVLWTMMAIEWRCIRWVSCLLTRCSFVAIIHRNVFINFMTAFGIIKIACMAFGDVWFSHTHTPSPHKCIFSVAEQNMINKFAHFCFVLLLVAAYFFFFSLHARITFMFNSVWPFATGDYPLTYVRRVYNRTVLTLQWIMAMANWMGVLSFAIYLVSVDGLIHTHTRSEARVHEMDYEEWWRVHAYTDNAFGVHTCAF